MILCSLPGPVKDLGLKWFVPNDLNIKLYMLLLSKLGEFPNPTTETLVVVRI